MNTACRIPLVTRCGARIRQRSISVAARGVSRKQAPEQVTVTEDSTAFHWLPMEEVQTKMQEGVQLGNCGFCKEAESAMCAQINVEQTIGHIYESLSAYFGRDNVSLPGLAAFFAKEADEERKHARLIIDYVNERGGIVKLGAIEAPHGEFREAEKGDALNAMELALALEKLNFDKLYALDKLATDLGDYAMSDFVDDMLSQQSRDVKKAADMVAQLMRVGKGHGTWAWDDRLLETLGGSMTV